MRIGVSRNLKTYRFLDEEITRMGAEERASETPLIDRYHLCFALGKAYEDRGMLPSPGITTNAATR